MHFSSLSNRALSVFFKMIYQPKHLSVSPYVRGEELFSLRQSYQMLSQITVCSLSDAWEFHVVHSDSAERKLAF